MTFIRYGRFTRLLSLQPFKPLRLIVEGRVAGELSINPHLCLPRGGGAEESRG
jgi:hypothetical protein